MIASVLVFMLGALATALVALLLAPLLWRKAQDFARREYEATLPATANEIRAEFDVVRAAAAMDVRRAEIETAAMRERMGKAEAEFGRANVEIASLSKRNRDQAAEMAAFAAERDNFREIFAAHRDKERALSDTLDEAKRGGSLNAEELEALAVRFKEVSALAEVRKVELVAAETKIERLTDALRSVERASGEKDTLIRLLRREVENGRESRTADISSRRVSGGLVPGMPWIRTDKPPVEPQPPEPVAAGSVLATSGLREALERFRAGNAPGEAAAGELRERIAEVAANVIHRTATAEGPDSPLALLLRPAPDASAAAPAGAYRSLASRVRELASPRGDVQGADIPPNADRRLRAE